MSRTALFLNQAFLWIGVLVAIFIILVFAGLFVFHALSLGLEEKVVKKIPSPDGYFNAFIARADSGGFGTCPGAVYVSLANTTSGDDWVNQKRLSVQVFISQVIRHLHWADSRTLVIERGSKEPISYYNPNNHFNCSSGTKTVTVRLVTVKSDISRRPPLTSESQ